MLSSRVRHLSEILQPARERGPELEVTIGKLFGAMNVYTGDEGKLKAQVASWCEELQDFPLFAIRKAARWSVRGSERLPSLSAFIADVRLAMGKDVAKRAETLRQLTFVKSSKSNTSKGTY